ncbi:hypothetical protein ACXX9E_28505 [Pseudomonas sp. GNP014]
MARCWCGCVAVHGSAAPLFCTPAPAAAWQAHCVVAGRVSRLACDAGPELEYETLLAQHRRQFRPHAEDAVRDPPRISAARAVA